MPKKLQTKTKKAAKRPKSKSVKAGPAKAPKVKSASKKFSSKTEFSEEKIAELIKRGKIRGFITYSEILSKFRHIERKDLLEVEEKKPKQAKLREALEHLGTDSVQMYLREIGKIALLTADEEKEFAKKIEKGDEDSKNRLALANLRLVVSIAKRYVGRSPNL